MSKSFEVHSFECTGETHLFLWVNDSGIKFASYYGQTYTESKAMFSERLTSEFMSRPSGHIRGVVSLNEAIVKPLEVFTACPN